MNGEPMTFELRNPDSRFWDASKGRWYCRRPEDGAYVAATAPHDGSSYSDGWNACLKQLAASMDSFKPISRSYTGDPQIIAMDASEDAVRAMQKHIRKLAQS
jgi:hypothetical protein